MARSSREAPVHQLTRGEARAVRVAAQGLAPTPSPPGGTGDLLSTLESTGFVRTLGGADVYLALRARISDLDAADLDAALLRREVRIVPAARGCIYLVSARHAPLALALAARLSEKRNARDAEKAGIEPGELEVVAAAVLETLEARGGGNAEESGGMTTDALRKALPDGAVRSLGEAGKKVGLSSTLPPALRQLEFAGRIERIPATGRLDTERYLWAPARPSPVEPLPVPDDAPGVYAAVGEIFYRAVGVAGRRDLAAWMGIGQGDAKKVTARLDLVPVEVEGEAETVYAHPDHRDLVAHPPSLDTAVVHLLPFEDNLVGLHGGPASLVDPRYHDVPVPVWGRGKGGTLGDTRHPFLRSVAAGGKIVGLWEYDPDSKEVVAAVFDPPSPQDGAEEAEPAFSRALGEATTATGRFLRDELGHGRRFSIDTDEKLRAGVRFLRTEIPGAG